MSESDTYTNFFSTGANTSRDNGEMPITTEEFHSLRTYRTSVFPVSLYRNESSIGERTLYKTLLLIRILRKTVRQEQIQDTKSTQNRTSVFTKELNKRVHESKQCIQGWTLALARSPRRVSKVSGECKSQITRPFGECDFSSPRN